MKALLTNAALFLAGLGMALGLGEAAARGLGLSKTWESYRAAPRFITAEMTTGQAVGYHRLPRRTWDGPFGNTISTNSRGFREEEPPADPPSDELRVAWLGDSVTEGYGLSREERFSDLVEGILSRELGRPVRSLNFGVAGHGAADYVAVLERHVLPLEPHAVVIQTNAGDAQEALAKRDRFLARRWDEELRRRPPEPPPPCPPVRVLRALGPGGASECELREVLRGHSALYLALAERWNLFLLRRGHARAELPGLGAPDDEALEIFRTALQRAARACDAAGVPLLAVYSPLEAEVQLGQEEADMAVRAPFLHVLREVEGLQLLDLTPRLREERTRNLYLDNIHLTATGNQVAAETIGPVLARVIQMGDPP